MRRGRLFILLALIIVIGFALVYFVYTKGLFSKSPGAEQTTTAELATPTPIPIQVVVVTQRVERGDILSADKLELRDMEADKFKPNMFTQISDVAGKMARYSMDSFTVVTSALVTESPLTEQGSDDALYISPGMVAVSIPITRLSSVSYAPQRGDHVNVIVTMLFVDLDPTWQTILPNWTGNVIGPAGGAVTSGGGLTDKQLVDTLLAQPFRGGSEQGRAENDPTLNQTLYLLPSEGQRPRLVSQTLIQNVIVLQMGNFLTPAEKLAAEATQPAPTATPEPGAEQTQPENAPTPTPMPAPPDVITLIVSPQDAVTLNYLIYGGAQLTLVLRNPRDAEAPGTEAVTLSYLLDQYNIPIPVKLPYGLEPSVKELGPVKLPNDATATPVP